MAFTTLTAFRESTALATAEASATPTIDGAGSAARGGAGRAPACGLIVSYMYSRNGSYPTPPHPHWHCFTWRMGATGWARPNPREHGASLQSRGRVHTVTEIAETVKRNVSMSPFLYLLPFIYLIGASLCPVSTHACTGVSNKTHTRISGIGGSLTTAQDLRLAADAAAAAQRP